MRSAIVTLIGAWAVVALGTAKISALGHCVPAPERSNTAHRQRLGVKVVQSSEAGGDQELGILRLRQSEPSAASGNQELGILRVRQSEPSAASGDQELGILRLRQPSQTPPKAQHPQSRPIGYLTARVSYVQTNNAFFLANPVHDSLTQAGLTLGVTPALGPRTYFVAAIDGSLVHYTDRSEFNYNQLNLKAGISQQLSPVMFGEIGWNNQQLFTAKQGNLFLNEQAVYLSLQRRDLLSQRLVLDTSDEVRLSFADPNSYSRLINYLGLSLSYYIRTDLQVGLDYQFGFENFTQRNREDIYHRLQSRLSYTVSRNSYISVQGGLTLGDSSNSSIDFNSLYFGVSYTLQLGQF